MGILEPIISLIVFAVIIAIIVAKTKNIWGKYPYTNGGKATKEYYVRQKKKKGGVSINSAGSYRLIE